MKVFAGIGGIDLFLGVLLKLEQIEVLQALTGAERIAGTLGGSLAGAFGGTLAGAFDRTLANCFCHRMVL
jgi:flagellar motor component MotA